MHYSPSFRRLVGLCSKVLFTFAFLVIAAHAFFVGGTITVGIVATVGVIVTMLLLQLAHIILSSKWLVTMQKEVANSFPLIILSMSWRQLTTRGAVVGSLLCFVLSIALIVAGPQIWHSIISAKAPLFLYDYPALFTMTATLFSMYLVSIINRSAGITQDRERFDKQLVAAELASHITT